MFRKTLSITIAGLALAAAAPAAASACSQVEGISIEVVNADADRNVQQDQAAQVQFCAKGAQYTGAATLSIVSQNIDGSDKQSLGSRSITLAETMATDVVDHSMVAVGRAVTVTITKNGTTNKKAYSYKVAAPTDDGGPGTGDPEPDNTPDPIIAPVPQQKAATPVINVTVSQPAAEPDANQNSMPAPCNGTITKLYWQKEKRKSMRGKLTIKGSTAKAKKGLRLVFRGEVKGCKVGSILKVNANNGLRWVQKTGLRVRKGGKFTGFAEMNATSRTIKVSGKNSKKLKLTRIR